MKAIIARVAGVLMAIVTLPLWLPPSQAAESERLVNWLWRPRLRDPGREKHRAFAAELDRGGWQSWFASLPPLDERVEMWRYEWDMPIILSRCDLCLETNVAGLYWRPITNVIDITPQHIGGQAC